MDIEFRSYSSKVIRPRPVVKQSEDRKIMAVITPWGSIESAETTASEIFRFVETAMADVEVTSPFEMLSCLSAEANYLRTALSIANESMHRGVNKSFYNEGVEALLLYQADNTLSWASVGFPQVILQKKDFPIQTIVSGIDLNFELGKAELAPLPNQLLGLSAQCNINAGSLQFQREEDRVILYSASYINVEAYSQIIQKKDLESLTRILSSSYPDMPFWLAQISL